MNRSNINAKLRKGFAAVGKMNFQTRLFEVSLNKDGDKKDGLPLGSWDDLEPFFQMIEETFLDRVERRQECLYDRKSVMVDLLEKLCNHWEFIFFYCLPEDTVYCFLKNSDNEMKRGHGDNVFHAIRFALDADVQTLAESFDFEEDELLMSELLAG